MKLYFIHPLVNSIWFLQILNKFSFSLPISESPAERRLPGRQETVHLVPHQNQATQRAQGPVQSPVPEAADQEGGPQKLSVRQVEAGQTKANQKLRTQQPNNFPADGDYVLRVREANQELYRPGVQLAALLRVPGPAHAPVLSGQAEDHLPARGR